MGQLPFLTFRQQQSTCIQLQAEIEAQYQRRNVRAQIFTNNKSAAATAYLKAQPYARR